MSDHIVARMGELSPGERKIVEIEGRSIGVFNVGGRFYALRNSCPHQAGPLCLGSINGMIMPGKPGEYMWACEGEILRCPWHGWEFNIITGQSIFNPRKTRVRSYEVSVEPEHDERIETYPVSAEGGLVVLHL